MKYFLFALLASAGVYLGQSESVPIQLGSCSSTTSKQVPGVVPADISADGQGGVKVSIGLEVPRGSGGRDPGLLLKYSSSSRNGRFGYGWTLAYLPTISRCPRTRLRNGYGEKVTFTSDDVFCVGGKQLIPVPGNESRYYAESFDKTVYQAFGAQSSNAGPLYWISSRSDGVRTVYGQTPNSQIFVAKEGGEVILAWKPNSEIDPYGNTINITYDNFGDGREIYMSNITYAEGKTAVIFEYEKRSDNIISFFSGTEQVISRRLQRVTTYSAMPEDSLKTDTSSVLIPVRRYDLTYIVSKLNGVSLVETVTMCSGCYEMCELPFQFTYAMTDMNPDDAWPYPVNFSKTDYSMFEKFSPGIRTSTSSKGFRPSAVCNVHEEKPVVYPTVKFGSDKNVQLSVDANSDGLTDLVFVQYAAYVGIYVDVFLSNGKGGFNQAGFVPNLQPISPFACETLEEFCCGWRNLLLYEAAYYDHHSHAVDSVSFTVFSDDSRGGGIIDLTAVVLANGPVPFSAESCNPTMPKLFILSVNGKHDGTPVAKLTANSELDFQHQDKCSSMFGDVTDDFVKDVIVSCMDEKGWRVWTLNGSQANYLVYTSEILSTPFNEKDKSARNVFLRDIDGDGSPDLALVSVDPSGLISIYFSKSLRNGKFAKATLSYKHSVPGWESIFSFFTDLPGGVSDLVVCSATGSALCIYVFPSKGDGTFSESSSPRLVPEVIVEGTIVFPGDVNGDGIPEILAVSPGGTHSSYGLRFAVLYLKPQLQYFNYQYPPIPSKNFIGSHFDETNTLFYSDFTGDNKIDFGIFRVCYSSNGRCLVEDLAVNMYILPSTLLKNTPFNKLVEMKDGNGLTSKIQYSRMTDPKVYIQEGTQVTGTCNFWPDPSKKATTTPFVDFKPNPDFLLHQISHLNAASTDPSDVITIAYVYRGYGKHTRGYNSLGFQFVFAYHSNTRHSQLTSYSRDYLRHQQGHPVSVDIYKCVSDSTEPIKLSQQSNEWLLMTRISENFPGFYFGSYFVVLTSQEQRIYSEDGLALTQIKTKTVLYDPYGLPNATVYTSQDVSNNSKPFPHLENNFYNHTLEIEYVEPFYAGHSWFVGLPSAAVESSTRHYGSINSEVDYTIQATSKRADRTYSKVDGSLISESFSTGNSSDPEDVEHTLTIFHQRDQRGNIISVSFVSSQGVKVSNKTMKYDANGRFQTALCSSENVCNNWLYGHNGQILLETLQSGEKINHTYNELFREIRVVSNFGKAVRMDFDLCTNSDVCSNFPTAVYFRNTTSMFGSSAYEMYDKLDRNLGSTLKLEKNDDLLIQKNVFDSFGGLFKRTPVHYESDPSNETMVYLKDDSGRTNEIRRTYRGPNHNLFWQKTSLNYSSNRVDVSATDSSNATVWKQARISDSLGDVSVVDEINIDHVLQYWYNPNGDVVATVINTTKNDGALVYRAKFDKFGAPYEISLGNSGRYQYSHDTFGQLLNQTDPSGNVVSFRRNEQEQVLSVFSVKPTGELIFVHNFTYNDTFLDKIDREYGKTEGGCLYAVNNTFDNRGLLVNTTVTLGNHTASLAYEYSTEESNRLERIQYPDGVAFVYQYDDKNRIVQIFDNSSNRSIPLTLWKAWGFDEEGRPSNEIYGNNLQTMKDFQPWGISFTTTLLTSNVTAIGNRMTRSEPAFSFSTNFDASGRVVSREKSLQGKKIYSELFSYDENHEGINRTSLLYNESYSVQPVRFSYGNFSNMVYKSDVGNYTYKTASNFGTANVNLVETTPVNRVFAVKSSEHAYNFTYDERGNRVSWNGTVITYNSRNKPVNISRGPFGALFEYSPLGKLLMKEDVVYIKLASNATVTPVIYRRTWYTNDFYEEEVVREDLSSSVMTKKIQRFYASTNVLLEKTTYLNSSKSTMEYYYLHYDTKTSLAYITNQQGSIVWEADYDVCGRKRDSTSGQPMTRYQKVMELIDQAALTVAEAQEMLPSLNSNFTLQMGYDGHIHLHDLGDDLVHMRGRLYDTVHCLFLTPDPYLANRWRVVGYNSYSYGENNPLSSTDPSGFSFLSVMRHILAFIMHLLAIFLKISEVVADAAGQIWDNFLSAGWTMLADYVNGDSTATILEDGGFTLLNGIAGMITDGAFAAEKISETAAKVIDAAATMALDGAKGAVTAATSGEHSYKSILLSAGIGLAEGIVGTVASNFGIEGNENGINKASVTKLRSYSSVPCSIKAEIKSIVKKIAKDSISVAAEEALKLTNELTDKYAFSEKQEKKEFEFISRGKTSMNLATMTDGPRLFTSELKNSEGHDVYRKQNSPTNSQFSHMIRSFVPQKSTLSVDALANIEKATDSFGLSHVSLHNHAIIKSHFAGHKKKSVREELFLFDRISQLILAPSANGKCYRQG